MPAIPNRLKAAFLAGQTAILLVCSGTGCRAAEVWEKLDKRLKSQVYELNVGLKLHLKGGQWVQLSDFSPRYHYPVYSTSNEDKGYEVVGFGSSFPVKTTRSDKTYFLTNQHVVNSGDNLAKECERFFAATRLYAEQTANGTDGGRRYQELLGIINLSTKKGMTEAERALYQQTVDAIWDTYDTYLSIKADPSRLLFSKYSAANGVEPDIGYFLHAPGPVTQPPLEGKLYKVASNESEPDIAILTVAEPAIPPLEFDRMPPAEGQEIQVIGYPEASDQIDPESSKYYAPTFKSGRISRVTPNLLQVDAPIRKGNSGGPVVSERGKVVGVVAVRAISDRGDELPKFGGAVTIPPITDFAPELFEKMSAR